MAIMLKHPYRIIWKSNFLPPSTSEQREATCDLLKILTAIEMQTENESDNLKIKKQHTN